MKKLILAGGALLLSAGALLSGVHAGPPLSAFSISAGGSAASDASCASAPSGAGGVVAKAAYDAGFRGDNLVVAIAVSHAESGWNPAATNANTNGSTDYGLWQINSVHAALLAHGDWHDPRFNASVAFQIWSDAHGWSPWVTYWSGSYAQYMPAARVVVGVLSTAACTTGLTDPGPGPEGPGDHLTPRTENVKGDTVARWGCENIPKPCISTIYGYAARNVEGTGVVSDHALGKAIDIMLGSDYKSPAKHALGEQIANYWATNLAAVGGHYVIFDKRIFTSESGRWRPYVHPSGGHNDTLDHVNHVHLSMK